ncbi:MAG: PilT/PilU family type 4a pilus ATPase [Candidatus Omnitrophica bacterium]|nr:PilT/PilU family type 4a pilus ATPase [Candidatus Omnitrophota bacterium]
MHFTQILDVMIEKEISDVFIRANSNLRGRRYSLVEVINENIFSVEDVDNIVKSITSDRDKAMLKQNKACEFTYWFKENWRFRVGVFYQRNTLSLVMRKIDLRIPTFEQLNLPAAVLNKFCAQRRGMILLTGITGSGKSTTIASIMECMNQNFKRHILTVEEPIEFTFVDKKSIINQREIGTDVGTYADALRQFTLHSPDVIFIGNIRDEDTCRAALTAAETGVLVLSTLHTVNASSTIDRLINFFPPYQHHLVLEQLSYLLKGVFSQRLLPRSDTPGLIPAYESMVLSPSVSRLLIENKVWELPKYIASGDIYGMKSFHQCLLELVATKKITSETAIEYADKKEELEMELRNKGLM